MFAPISARPNKWSGISGFVRWVAAVLGCLAIPTYSCDGRAATNQVVVTIKPVHAIAAAVMEGTGAPPRLLIDGSASPHTFALKPSDARALQSASVLIRVSEGVEPFTIRLAKSLPSTLRLVTLESIPGLVLHDLRTGGMFEAHDHGKRGHEHGHSHGQSKTKSPGSTRDGHLWLDPANAKLIAAHLAEVLAAIIPAHADRFRSNAVAFSGRIDELVPGLEAKLAPNVGKPYVVFHDAYQYFEHRFGLAPIGAVTVNPDVPPSAKRLNELRTRIRSAKAACVFAEPQFEPKLVETILEGTGAKRGVLDPIGATLPAGPDQYFALMHGLADSLSRCLGNSS